MVASSVSKPAAKNRRHAPLLVGLLIAAVAAGGYLGRQHFSHNPAAAVAEAPPPVPVIAATVQKQNFPIVLIGIGNVAALNSATSRRIIVVTSAFDPKRTSAVNRCRIAISSRPTSTSWQPGYRYFDLDKFKIIAHNLSSMTD